MKHSGRRALLAMTIGMVVLTTTGCGPEAADGWMRFAQELFGGVLGIVIAIIVIIAGLPPM